MSKRAAVRSSSRREYRLKTRLGDFLAAFEKGKLTELRLPGAWRRARKPPFLRTQEGTVGRKLLRELSAYLAGRRVEFTVPTESQGTAFQKRVWSAMRRIRWGRTASYGELARMAGSARAARAAGSACGRNPIVIINPCHRVVAAGGPGGFGAGPAWKRRLLRLEGHDC